MDLTPAKASVIRNGAEVEVPTVEDRSGHDPFGGSPVDRRRGLDDLQVEQLADDKACQDLREYLPLRKLAKCSTIPSLVLFRSSLRRGQWLVCSDPSPEPIRADGSFQVIYSIRSQRNNMDDKTLNCRDCGKEFIFTVGEQEFFAQKGFTNTPSRCPECRAANKASRGGYSGGSGGGFERREREMFPAVCAQCGKDTMVPFQPSGDKPVYCSDCFSAQRSSGGGYGGGNRSGGGGGRGRY